MTAWLKGSNKPNQQILDYAASDDPGCGKEFVFSLCRLRHMAARLREERGERHGYDPCCYCPKFVTQKGYKPKPENTQEESKTMTTEPALICIEPNCNNPVSGHSKTGRCHSCAAKISVRLAHEARRGKKTAPETGAEKPKWESCADKLEKPAPKTGAKKSICYETSSKVAQEKSNVTFEPTAVIDELPVSITELQRLAHKNAVAKGWHETPRADGEMICLMHSELSEALEELRNGKSPAEIYFKDKKPEGVPIELADVVIRIFDFCGLHNINLQSAIVTKMVYNQTRPHRHGGKKL